MKRIYRIPTVFLIISLVITMVACATLSCSFADTKTSTLWVEYGGSVRITNAEGEYIDVVPGHETKGTMKFDEQGGVSSGMMNFTVNYSSAFTITYLNKNKTTVSLSEPYAELTTTGASSATITQGTNGADISVTGTGAKYSIENVSDNRYATLEGTVNGTVDMKAIPGGEEITGSSGQTHFKSYDINNSLQEVNAHEINYTPTADPVTITNLSGDKLKVTGATYTIVQHTVTFDTKGGSTVAPITVDTGSLISPKPPTKDGYTFKGWTDRYGEYFNLSRRDVTEDMTLYAIWTKNPITRYAVTFDSQGGTKISSQSVEKGNMITQPANPTLDGYVFKGWFTKGGALWNFKTGVTGNMTLYAHWEKKANPISPPTGDDSGMAAPLMMALGAGMALLFVRRGRRQ